MDLKERIKRATTGGNKTAQLSLRLQQADLEELDRICTQTGVKRQAAIEDAIRDWIKDAKKTLAAEKGDQA